jgi:L-serine dehydratase
MTDIINYISHHNFTFWNYISAIEDPGLLEFLTSVWQAMEATIESGLKNERILPGELKLPSRAANFFKLSQQNSGMESSSYLIAAYALASSEENARAHQVVTAPTCGSCGVLPGVLKFLQIKNNFSMFEILKSLATAGLIGNVVRFNASISGAEVGCQGEIGTASAMAAGAAAQLLGGNPAQIEHAAEMVIEHSLGMTCDPMRGLVQIPCIERNAFWANQALFSANYSLALTNQHRLTFDMAVETMKRTGRDLHCKYRETSDGGLALLKLP